MEMITIAIDGYSSCGKSTLAKDLAKRLQYKYIDTGAMYRAFTLYCLNNGLVNEEGKEVYNIKDFVDDIHIDFALNEKTNSNEVLLNGKIVEGEIRNMRVSKAVTYVSAIKEVRAKMVVLQKKMGGDKGVVMDGRDIGTVVFPDAELKIFMTADPEIRVTRRYNELRGKGMKVSREEIANNLKERDYQDTHRKESPLRRAEDAIVIDNSDMDKGQQLDIIFGLAQAKIDYASRGLDQNDYQLN